jgi:hypothetical protein
MPDVQKAFQQASPALQKQLVQVRNMMLNEATAHRPEVNKADAGNEMLRSKVVEPDGPQAPKATPNPPSKEQERER